MANRLVRFCYCGECEAVVEETVTMVRWFESEFCNAECLEKFIRKNVTNCFECRNGLAQHQIHAIKSVNTAATGPETVASAIDGQPVLSISSASLFAAKYFCSADCLNAHKMKNLMCGYCSKPMVTMNRTETMEAGNQRHIAFCSEECRMLMQMCYNNNQLFVGICDHCTQKGNIIQRCLIDGADYMFCSANCRFEFEMRNEINLETCNQCTRYFAHNDSTAFVILDLDCDVVFCGAKCMGRYMMTVERPSICVQCSVVGNYYTMIRSAQNMLRRSWCSLECTLKEGTAKITEEEMIDLTLNQEAFFGRGQDANDDARHLVKSQSEPSSEVFIVDDSKPLDKPKSDKVISYSPYVIKPLTDSESKALLEDRRASYKRNCQACQGAIINSTKFLRWYTMEFCDAQCFGTFIDSKIGCLCWSCTSIIGQNHLCVHVERIENELRLFCSEECMTTYCAANKMCDHCGKLFDSPRSNAGAAKRFCSVACDRKFRRLNTQEVDRTVKPCTDCRLPKRVLVNFVHDNQMYPYCSFTCFFLLKFSCGIFADKCQMCTNYFVRRSTAAHTVRFDNMAHIFCSAICVSHFMRKYRTSVTCTFCMFPNYDVFMVTLISDRGTNEKPFCSKSCLELFNETENAVLVNVGENDAERSREYISMLRSSKDHQVSLPGKKTSVDVGTQTEWLFDCNNNDIHTNKENIPRMKLAARKRNACGKPMQTGTNPKALVM